jgi:hypothetical protein
MIKDAVKKALDLAGFEVRRKRHRGESLALVEGSRVVPRIWDQPAFKDLIPFRFNASPQSIVLLGSAAEIAFLRPGLVRHGREVTGIEWGWESGTQIGGIPDEAQIVVCKLPVREDQWRVVKGLKARYGSRITGLQELVLPFTTILQAQASLEYLVPSLAEITPFYAGDAYFGPLDKLKAAFPLAGKRVIEFGPMEGAQTAGLIHLGARSVTCIEAREVSFIKTAIARYCFGWDDVNLVMDDFHNADREKYGEFDLAFAHGVYYHSMAPFLFFENLMSLSDNIFIGGYCTAKDAAPSPPSPLVYSFETLEYEGKTYAVKKIRTGNSYNSAVNLEGYHFDRNDLLNFFRDRGYEVTVVRDEGVHDPWGNWYLQFLARRSPATPALLSANRG